MIRGTVLPYFERALPLILVLSNVYNNSETLLTCTEIKSRLEGFLQIKLLSFLRLTDLTLDITLIGKGIEESMTTWLDSLKSQTFQEQ